MEKTEVKKMCQDHMYRYVCVWMEDGSMYDGIVESVDGEYLSLAVPVGSESMEQMSAPAYTSYPQMVPCGCPPPPCVDTRAYYPVARGFGPFGGFHGGGFFPGRRRFNRLLLPLIGLTALTILPLL